MKKVHVTKIEELVWQNLNLIKQDHGLASISDAMAHALSRLATENKP